MCAIVKVESWSQYQINTGVLSIQGIASTVSYTVQYILYASRYQISNRHFAEFLASVTVVFVQ
jgi:hypothetical protein